MQTTTNYGFSIAEGADPVNLLTQLYPNFTSLDSILLPIQNNGTTPATHTKAGTVHQLVRTTTGCSVLRFVATGNYNAGDTFTVDGASVTATSCNGQSLPAGAFVINQSVMAIVNGAVLTVLAGGSSISDASDVTYDNTTSGLTATNVQTAIDEVVNTFKDAENIDYDNTGSGLVATDVQSAIDELASGGGGSDYDSIFSRMFTFTKSEITFTPVSGTNSPVHSIYGFENVDRSLFKIDGSMVVTGASIVLPASGQLQSVKMADMTGFTVSAPATAYDIQIGPLYTYAGSAWSFTNVLAYIHVDTTGAISLYGRNVGSGSNMTVSQFLVQFIPCLYESALD